jgi:hypothetical protein
MSLAAASEHSQGVKKSSNLVAYQNARRFFLKKKRRKGK